MKYLSSHGAIIVGRNGLEHRTLESYLVWKRLLMGMQ